MMPSIFGENLFDELFDDDFPMIPMRSICLLYTSGGAV